MEKKRTSITKIVGRVICGLASGYAFLILFVLALGASNMTIGLAGPIGEMVSVNFTIPLFPTKIVLWHTRFETLEMVKIIAILTIFVITSTVSSLVFIRIKNLYNIFFILGLEYLPIPIVGKSLRAQGMSLYFIMFVIGVCLICYAIALRTIIKHNNYDSRFYGY